MGTLSHFLCIRIYLLLSVNTREEEEEVFLSRLKEVDYYFNILLWIKRTAEGQNGNLLFDPDDWLCR